MGHAHQFHSTIQSFGWLKILQHRRWTKGSCFPSSHSAQYCIGWVFYRTTCSASVVFFDDSNSQMRSSTLFDTSCQMHLLFSIDTSSSGGRKMTSKLMHNPSPASTTLLLPFGACSMERMPCGRCCGNSAPNNSIINLRSVA